MPHRQPRTVIPVEPRYFDGGYSALDATRLRPNQFTDPFNQKAGNWWRDRQGLVRIRDGNDLLIGSVGAVGVAGLFDFRRESDQINRLMLYASATVYESVQPALASYAAVITGFSNNPVVTGAAGGANTVGTSHSVTLPVDLVAGELLLIQFASGAAAPTWPSGWTQIFESGAGHSGNRMAVAYRIATGTEGASITVTTPTSARSAYQSFRISGHGGSTKPPVASAGAFGSTATPDPATFTPAGGPADFLWFAMISYGVQTQTPPSAYPTNYTDGVAYGTTEGSGSEVWVAQARRAVYGSTEDPGTFTLSGVNDWHAVTIAIFPATLPAATTAGWGVSTQDAFWFDPGVGPLKFYNPTYPSPTVTRVGIRAPTVLPQAALNSDAIGQPTIGTVSTATGSSLSATVSHVVSGSDTVLLVIVGVTPLTRVKSVTYGGVALQLLAAQNRGQHQGTNDCRVEIWYRINPTAGTASVLVTMDESCNINVAAITAQNIHQTSPFGSVVSGAGENTAPALNVISKSGELVLDAIVVKSSVASDLGAVGGGQTEKSRTNISTAIMGTSTEAGAQFVDMNWTMPNSKPWAHLGVPLKNLAGASTVLPEDIFWRYTYVRENSGVKVIESNPSAETATALNGNVAGPDVDVRLQGSSDTQVTHVYLYRRSSISSAQHKFVTKATNTTGAIVITDDFPLEDLGAAAFWEPSGGTEDHGVPDDEVWGLTLHRDDRMYVWTANSEVQYSRVGQHHYWPGATDGRGGFIIAVAVDDGDEGMAIASESDDVLLLKRAHVYRLMGEGPSIDNGDPGSWKIVKLPTTYGCVAKRSVAVGVAGAFWMADIGPVQVSQSSGIPEYIGPDIEPWINQSTDKSAAFGQIVDHHYLLTLPFAGGPQTMAYDSRNGSWWPILGMQIEGMATLEDLRVVWAGKLGDGPQATTYQWSDDFPDDDGTAIAASLLSSPVQLPVWSWCPEAELTVRATTWRPTLYWWRPVIHSLPRDRVSAAPAFSQVYSTLPSGDPTTGITLTTRLYADASENAYLERLIRAFGAEGSKVTKRLPGDRRLQGRTFQLQVDATTSGITVPQHVITGGPHTVTTTSSETDLGAVRTRATVRMARTIPAASSVFTSLGYANTPGGPYTFTTEQTAAAFEDATINGRYLVYKVRLTGTATVQLIEVTVWH